MRATTTAYGRSPTLNAEAWQRNEEAICSGAKTGTHAGRKVTILAGNDMGGIVNLVGLQIAIAAFLVRRTRRSRPSARWLGMFYRPALTLCALWTFSSGCLASDRGIPSFPEMAIGASPDLGIAIGDLDGDGRPEIAIVRSEGLGPKGLQYRIDLSLTTHALPNSFTVSTERGGLRIFPRDVDGDGDLDLVVTTTFLAPVGVWINDGRGGLAEGDPAAYPSSIWNEGRRIWVCSRTSNETFPATLLKSRTWLDPPSSLFGIEFIFENIPLLPASGSPQEPAVTRRSNRGPPQSSRTWPYFSLSCFCPTEFIFGHIAILPATGSPQGPAVNGLSNRGPPPSLLPQSNQV